MNNITNISISPNSPYNVDTWLTFLGFGAATTISNCFILIVLILNWKLLKKNALITGLAIGDTIDGLALLVSGAVRIMRTQNGTINNPVHPSYCMISFLTPLFLLGNQIPGFMFTLVGVERLVAVVYFKWYYTKWSNKLAWILVAVIFLCSTVSLMVAFGVVLSLDSSARMTLICGTGGTIGAMYSMYNYGISVTGGIVAVVATVVAMFNFNKRKRAINQGTETATDSVKYHVKKQWRLTRVMLFLAVLDLGLVVTPNFLVGLGSVFSIQSFSGLYPWSLQIISLRSFLNVFIYIGINSEFRSAVLNMTRNKWPNTVSVGPNVEQNNQILSRSKTTTNGSRNNCDRILPTTEL